jgi:hypothetical protein
VIPTASHRIVRPRLRRLVRRWAARVLLDAVMEAKGDAESPEALERALVAEAFLWRQYGAERTAEVVDLSRVNRVPVITQFPRSER